MRVISCFFFRCYLEFLRGLRVQKVLGQSLGFRVWGLGFRVEGLRPGSVPHLKRAGGRGLCGVLGGSWYLVTNYMFPSP